MIRTRLVGEMVRTTVPGEATTGMEIAPRMPRSEITSFLKNPLWVKVPDSMIAPSPFFITSRRHGDAGFHKKPVVLKYGSDGRPPLFIMELRGSKLTVSDMDVFLGLEALAKLYKSMIFQTSIAEIVRIIGNEPRRDQKEKVRKSLERMQIASVRIKLRTADNGDYASYNVNVVVRHMTGSDDDDTKVVLELDPFLLRAFEETGVTLLDTKFRNSLKGDITKMCYAYFARQYGKGKPYPIGLRKLCRYINLETQGKQPWQYRQPIKKSLQELWEKGFFKTWSITDKNKILVVYPDTRPDKVTEEDIERAREQEMWEKRDRERKRKEAATPEGVCPHDGEFGSFNWGDCVCDREKACEAAKIARFREIEQGVPEGVCPRGNGHEFGEDYEFDFDGACTFCGRAGACKEKHDELAHDGTTLSGGSSGGFSAMRSLLTAGSEEDLVGVSELVPQAQQE